MYVLIDMEWVTNRHGNHWPTQLAAIRVDEEWQTVDSFSVLFRPKDITFQKWDHMAERVQRRNPPSAILHLHGLPQAVLASDFRVDL